MLTFEIGQTNNIIATLAEATTIASPYYILYMENVQTGLTAVCYAPDISPSPGRYQQFSIREMAGLTADGNNAQVNLIYTGDWTYTYFESSTETLSLAGLTAVENGRVRVYSSASVLPMSLPADTDGDSRYLPTNNNQD